ncbi:Uncharacterized protein APZ42_027465 [Daphnia magna]|uniref:Uncharacterized protein n=1 Tax=Daphnia magna TaxID=35525 RepID=A0A164RL90_9CRUS|nr:Uncharacterized protein APZ42_027465 [Daphnia magna]
MKTQKKRGTQRRTEVVAQNPTKARPFPFLPFLTKMAARPDVGEKSLSSRKTKRQQAKQRRF